MASESVGVVVKIQDMFIHTYSCLYDHVIHHNTISQKCVVLEHEVREK